MARNTADACMFCGLNPCRCGKPAKAALKVTRVRPSAAPTGPPSVTASRERISEVGAVTVASPVRPNLANVQRVKDPGTEEMARAVTVFAEAEMLHHSSLIEHRDLIRLPPHEIDRLIWRSRYAERLQQP